MKVSCFVALCLSMLVVLNNFFLAVLFVVCCSFTSVILIPSMNLIMQCRKTSSLLRRDVRSAHLSHPHLSRLVGMARNMSYLMWLSTLVSDHNLWRDPIYSFTELRCVSMS